MSEFLQVMALPLLACLVLAGIHAYLGFHVIERGVIFVDLALAQIAVLGASFAIVLGHSLDSALSYWFSLGFTVVGAAVFSLTRFPATGGSIFGGKKTLVPQEAIIGIVYAVSAAMLILVLSRSGEGDEHIRQTLIGNILLVSGPEVVKIAVIYSSVGIIHYIFRRNFFLISGDPQQAFRKGLHVRFWDFLFYVLFGIVVTSSVKIAGVLLVFALLVVPPVCAILFSENIRTRLMLGWITGFSVSALGIALSYWGDLPTGACVVVTFGVALTILSFLRKQGSRSI